MKWLIVLILIIGGCDPMPVSVPDTETFSLQDVYNAVADHASPTEDLDSCFDNSDPTYFDSNYNSESYAPSASMLRFRNYGPGNATYEIFVPEGFSPNGDGIHDYFEVFNLDHYPVHKMSILHSDGWVIYSRTNDYHLFPWNGKYGNINIPEGTYIWVLEINERPYDSGTVMLQR